MKKQEDRENVNQTTIQTFLFLDNFNHHRHHYGHATGCTCIYDP